VYGRSLVKIIHKPRAILGIVRKVIVRQLSAKVDARQISSSDR